MRCSAARRPMRRSNDRAGHLLHLLTAGFGTKLPCRRRRPMSEARVERTQRGHAAMAESDRPCVKTHTSAKCRKHNSPARHRTSRVQYDLTLRDAIARRYFYVWRDRWSFRTAKTRSRRRSVGNSGVQAQSALMFASRITRPNSSYCLLKRAAKSAPHIQAG